MTNKTLILWHAIEEAAHADGLASKSITPCPAVEFGSDFAMTIRLHPMKAARFYGLFLLFNNKNLLKNEEHF